LKKIKWILYLRGQKGWTEEAQYDNQDDGEYYLEEWKQEFPECKFKLVKMEV
tara:strand:+ start:741 stop:896 length:156 start_codon:yes stop_codon:yes gene_type:complete